MGIKGIASCFLGAAALALVAGCSETGSDRTDTNRDFMLAKERQEVDAALAHSCSRGATALEIGIKNTLSRHKQDRAYAPVEAQDLIDGRARHLVCADHEIAEVGLVDVIHARAGKPGVYFFSSEGGEDALLIVEEGGGRAALIPIEEKTGYGLAGQELIQRQKDLFEAELAGHRATVERTESMRSAIGQYVDGLPEAPDFDSEPVDVALRTAIISPGVQWGRVDETEAGDADIAYDYKSYNVVTETYTAFAMPEEAEGGRNRFLYADPVSGLTCVFTPVAAAELDIEQALDTMPGPKGNICYAVAGDLVPPLSEAAGQYFESRESLRSPVVDLHEWAGRKYGPF